MSQKEDYFIKVKCNLVPVLQEIYHCYYKMGRQERWREEKDIIHGTVFYSNLDTKNFLGEELICDSISQSVEEQVLQKILCDEIHDCISQLLKTEKELIQALFFDYFTERQYADLKGVSQSAINKRKKRIFSKMRNFFVLRVKHSNVASEYKV